MLHIADDAIAYWISNVHDSKTQIYCGIKPESMHDDPRKIVGHIGLTLDQEQFSRNLEVKFSYLIGPEYQRLGYATNATGLLFEFLSEVGFRNISTQVHV